MKKTILLATALFMFILANLFAQEVKDHYDVLLDEIHTVVFELSEETEIIATTENNLLSIQSTLFTKGEVRGWQFPSERPSFNINTRIEAGTLYVTSPERHFPKVIGICTYTETIQNRIICPANVEVIIKHADDLSVIGSFENLSTKKTENLTLGVVKKEAIKNLFWNSENVLVGGLSRASNYEYEGNGNQHYNLEATSISIASFQ